MLKLRGSEKWIDAGYALFATEGMDGVQIEKVARILKLNKSGFYHYFGTLEIFFERLVTHHHNMIDALIKDIQDSQNIDPDVLNALIKHHITMLAQVQLTRNKINPLFHSASEISNQKIDQAVLPVWAEHIGLLTNYDLALRFCGIVRDMFYTRIGVEDFNYSFLHSLAEEAKAIVADIFQEKDRLNKTLIKRQS